MSDRLAPITTAESVAAGHPDKLCDTISDAILDACLTIDSEARVAVETLVKGMGGEAAIVLAGEVSLNGSVPDYEAIARQTAASIGYTDHSIGMDATSHSTCAVHTYITTQSQYISQGVDGDLDSQGAGDQGIMFGYACNETEDTAELRGRFFPSLLPCPRGSHADWTSSSERARYLGCARMARARSRYGSIATGSSTATGCATPSTSATS
ncbi:MAG: hypothetical protein CM1200mP32_10550 [Methanobacteriota archaeon]|nr:MAG: hypothetical protein CM1200mP32_10550 [Euryarchaeota archaeon]